MKKYIITLSFLASLLLFSCSESFLDVTPKSSVMETEFYKTESDIYQALIAAYDPLQWDDYFNQFVHIPFVSDVRSGDVGVGGGSPNDNRYLQLMYTFESTPLVQPNMLWTIFYSGINRSNLVINKMDQIEEIEDSSKSRILAEAHFLRAYYYYWLWKFWGNVPYFDINLDEPYRAPQLSADEIYQKVLADLEYAISGNKLPESVSEEELGRITKPVAQMLKAQAVMYQKDDSKYAEILTDMKSIISSGNFELMANFEEIFLDEGEWCRESIWEINYTHQGGRTWGSPLASGGTVFPKYIAPHSLTGNTPYVSGWGFCPVSEAIYNLYPDEDQRKDGGILSFKKLEAEYPGITCNTGRYHYTGYFNKKYLGRKGYNDAVTTPDMNFKNNTRIFRYAETLLNASELLLRTGGSIAEAQAYLDIVRKRALGSSYTQSEVSLETILQERQLEFVCEGHRFWDLIRFDKAEEVLGSRGYVAYKKYLPIPSDEIDRTDGEYKLVQNPGYIGME